MEDMDGAIRRAVRRIKSEPEILAGCLRASGLFGH
jgi:hypothetical protein